MTSNLRWNFTRQSAKITKIKSRNCNRGYKSSKLPVLTSSFYKISRRKGPKRVTSKILSTKNSKKSTKFYSSNTKSSKWAAAPLFKKLLILKKHWKPHIWWTRTKKGCLMFTSRFLTALVTWNCTWTRTFKKSRKRLKLSSLIIWGWWL